MLELEENTKWEKRRDFFKQFRGGTATFFRKTLKQGVGAFSTLSGKYRTVSLFQNVLELFGRNFHFKSITTFLGVFVQHPCHFIEHSENIFQGGDSIGVSKPRFFGSNFEDQLPLRYWVSNNEWVVKKCGMDSGCPLKSTSTHNSQNSGSYERFSGELLRCRGLELSY